MFKPLFFVTSLLLASVTSYADSIIPSPVISPLSKTQNVIRGQLKAREFAVIAAGLSAKLTSFSVTHGQRVSKGDKIAVFNCRMESAEKSVAVAKLRAAQSKLSANKELKAYNSISHLEVSLSKAEVAIQSAELKRAKAVLSECTLTAPFSGIVVEKFAQAHQYIKVGDPLLELVNTSDLEIEMVVPSRWLTKLAIDTKFNIQFDEMAIPVEAKVTRNMGIIDPVSQTIRIVGKLITPSEKLLPGMSGEVSFYSEQSVSDINGVQ